MSEDKYTCLNALYCCKINQTMGDGVRIYLVMIKVEMNAVTKEKQVINFIVNVSMQ